MRRQKNNREVMDALVMVLQFGINMIVPICMCTLFGIWLGNKLGISWLCIPFFFIGALAGGNNIYKAVRKYLKSSDRGYPHSEIRSSGKETDTGSREKICK